MSATPVDPAAAGAASIPTDAPARATHRLLRLAIAAFALLIVLLIALHVHLYADGAFFLYQVIQTGATTEFAGGRGFAYLVTQWPLVLGLRAGVTRVETLSHLYGAGLYLPSLAGLACCAWVARGRPELLLFPVLSAVAVTASAAFFVISESHLLVSLFWPLVFLLALRRDWSVGTFVLAAALAVPTLLSYESMVFLGPVLAALAAWRARGAPGAARRLGFAALAAYFVAGIGVAAWWIVNPSTPSNLESFFDSLRFYRDHLGHWHVLGLLSLAGLMLAAAALLRPPPASWRRALLLVFALACAAAVLLPLLRPTSVAPLLHYRARVLNAYVPPLLALGFLLALRRSPRPAGWHFAAAVAAVLALAQLGWHAQAARYWAGYLDVFRREVATRHGLVPFDQSVLSRPEVGGRPLAAMNWGWTMPLMSVLLAPGGNVRSIVENPQRDHWQPFPPGDPDSLPDLSRVGIRFDAYRAALGER